MSSSVREPEVVSGPFPPASGRVFLRVFPSVMLPMFMAMGDQTIVASALPAIAGALGEVERISWIVVAYLLGATIAAPVYGYLGDSFGRRRLMFVALAVFTLGAVLNALAPSVTMIAASRFLQGLGGGGLMSLSQALIGEVIPPRQRGQYQGYLAGVAVTAAAFGPVAGAFLAEHFGWRAVFLINIPTACLAFVLLARLQARPGARKEGWNFDGKGLFFFVGFIVPLLLALEQARRLDPAGLQIAAGLAAFALVSLALLIRQERRIASPLLPVALMSQRAIWTAQAMAVCHGATLVAMVAFTPLYLRVMGLGSSAEVGYALLTVSAGVGFASMITGRIVTRTGLTMILPSFGSMATTGLFVYLSLNAAHMQFRELLICIGLIALSMGTVMGVIQVTVQTLAGRRMLGAAAGSVQLARSVGASFGTALFGTVLFATISATDPAAGRLFVEILQTGAGALASLDEARKAVLLGEIAGGFRAAFLMLAVFTACGATLAWLNPSRRI
ncbi:MAG: transporter [Hyphomicrobiales bacterium]|nr:transporter [Hyphomicrobiales bacterium]